MEKRLIIIGATPYGRVVCDAALAQGEYTIVGFADDSLAPGTTVMGAYQVVASLANIQNLPQLADSFIVAIEDNNDRKRVFEIAVQHFKSATIIHPSAVVGSTVTLGEGSVVLANAVVNSSIGKDTIVKPGVVIDHECVIGNHVHLGTGTAVRSPHGTFGKSPIVVGDGYSTVGQTLQMLMPQPVLLKGKAKGCGMAVGVILFIALITTLLVLLVR